MVDGGCGVIILLSTGEIRAKHVVPLLFVHTCCHLPAGSSGWHWATAGPSVSPAGSSASLSPAPGS